MRHRLVCCLILLSVPAVALVPTDLLEQRSCGIGALSPDGTLAMTIRSDEYELLLVDDRGNVERSVLSDPVEEIFPRFSPDGPYPDTDRRESFSSSLPAGRCCWPCSSRRSADRRRHPTR